MKIFTEKFSRILIILGFIIIVASIVVYKYSHPFNAELPVDSSLLDSFGSFIAGSAGTLWALAGVILFYVALNEQREDLKISRETLALEVKALEEQSEALLLQKKEFELTRIELEGQKQEFKLQNQTLRLQQFENTFFNLLKVQQEIRAHLEIQSGSNVYSGYVYFDEIKRQLSVEYERIPTIFKELDDYKKYNPGMVKNFCTNKEKHYNIDMLDDLLKPNIMSRATYKVIFDKYHTQLGHYFRNLYHLLKFLKDNEDNELWRVEDETRGQYINPDDIKDSINYIKKKYKRYSEYIQAQMGSSELFLLFYNALFFPKMKQMVYHYDLIENLSREDLLNHIDDVKFYFGETIDSETYGPIELKSRKDILKP